MFRNFHISALWIACCFAALPAPAQEMATTETLRIVAGNLTSGNLQSYDPGHGSRILQGLGADVALLQELRFGNNSSGQLEGWIRSVFGKDFFFFCEKAELPNGVASRFPIEESGSWDDPEQVNRDFSWSRILLPGGRKLLAVSVHLSAKNEEKREKSARALVRKIENSLGQDEMPVVGGDFNTQDRGEPALKILGKVVVIEAPYPADEDGNENTNHGRSKPYDGIYVGKALQEKAIAVALGGGPGGLVFDSRVFRDLSKVPPVEKEDSGAPQMQHMAVVRDFAWP